EIMAKKTAIVAEPKAIGAKEFVTAYVGSKNLADLQGKLKSLTGKEWDNAKIDQKISQMRKINIPLQTLVQLGWVQSKGKGRAKVDAEELAKLVAGSNKAATKAQMPKKYQPIA